MSKEDKVKLDNIGTLEISTGLIFDSGDNKLTVNYGDGLKIGDDYKLRLNLSSTPLYFDNSKHISIRCGSGLQVGTNDENNKLLINHGDSISVDSGKVDVNCGRGLAITTRGIEISPGNGLEFDNNKLNVKTSNNGGIYAASYGLEISTSFGLKVNENNELGITLRDGGGLEVDSNGLAVKHGDSLTVGYYNELNLNLVSSPLYMDDYNHISIRCGNGLRITTEYISYCNYTPELCVNYGNTLKMSDDHFLNVNISISTTNNDVAIGLI